MVNEIVNDSDSVADNIPELSGSEESESVSANESDDSNISILGPSRRQIDVTPTTGLIKMIVNQEYHPSQAIPECNLQM